MKQLSIRVIAIAAFAAAMTMVGTPAYAQGGGATSTISGTVVDASGAIVPGANVKAVNNATRAEFLAVSSDQGTFTIPSVLPGSYTVSVELMGFKTVTLKDVAVNAGVPATVKAVLEVGGQTETIVVEGGSSIVQTQTAAVSTTMDVNQISKLPLTSRHLLDFVATMPGVNTPGGIRNSTVNGLPQSTINITIDGMSAQDNHLKGTAGGDGFFARVSPRIDAIEEVSVSTAAQDASATGHGAVQIRFTTRSGSNQFSGSAYHYLRHYKLNANSWFNNRDLPPGPNGKAPKAEDVQYQPGTRVGGPIVIPGLFDGRDKAFFFVNYEQSRTPGEATRNRTILHPRSQEGWYRYDIGGGQVREINLFEVAARLGNTATADPTVAKLLADIRSASLSTGQVRDLTNPQHQQFTHQIATKGVTKYPTWRVDYNLSNKHKISSSMNFTDLLSTPDTTNTREPFFPGFPGTGNQHSERYTVQGTLRSTFTSNLVNELRIGRTGGATLFSPELGPNQFGGTSVADQGGYWIGLSAAGITNASNSSNYSAREAGTRVVENTLSWIRGSHSLSIGGGFTRGVVWLENKQHVPHVTFGIVSGDPAGSGMFTTANFPGASNTQLTAAQNFYALLTGRVNAVNATTRLNEATDQYEYLGRSLQRAHLDDWGFFISDTWRWRPNFTVTAGVRYELQMPFTADNNSYSTTRMADICGIAGISPSGGCNTFMPNATGGSSPRFYEFKRGERAYQTDYNNFGPTLGLNWVPSFQTGILRKVLGADGDSSLRAGYSLAFNRPGMSDFTGVYGNNPGVSITTNRTTGLGNLNLDGQGFPLLLRNPARLGAPPFSTTRQYPMSGEITGSVNAFDEDLQVPYSQTWTAGWQRKLSRDVVGEIRYVGTRFLQDWISYNYNEFNIVENGFLDEFRKAQGNLQANIAAGRGNTFAFTGVPGTSPLPTFAAFFNALPAGQAGDPTRYTGTNWTNTTWIGYLAARNPQPYNFASASTSSTTPGLLGDAGRRNNAAAAGLPATFFVPNPEALGGANLNGNGGYTKFNGLQAELRKRLSNGFQVQGSYAYGKGYESNRFSFRFPRQKRQDTGTEGSVTHAWKMNWIWELPFGQGRHFGSNAGPLLDRLIGGWSIDGVGRIQSGQLLNLGNVRLVNMTRDEVRDMFKLRFDDANRVVYMLPQDVIDNTVKAFSVSATSANGYGAQGAPEGKYFAPANGPDCIEIASGRGDCGVGALVVSGPRQVRFDISATKRLRLAGRTNFELRAEMINAFNHPWFETVGGIGNDPDNYRVEDTGDFSNRTIQIVTRFSW